ncbi:MAG: glycoside hydrolase family 65 protein [Acidobacteria bacterium]|nr:glycoside hydrolase family 65 protein [Acidobacteriota bacterium]
MIHHERVRPDPNVYPPDEWNVIEKKFNPRIIPHTETIMAVGNGYLGLRGCFEEGGPIGQDGTFINGFYETWPLVYGEVAYGFAKTGQTIVNATDTKIIKLFVDDEPFWLSNASLRSYDRRLNMKAGMLKRELLWETPSGKLVWIRSKRLVSFPHRHLAAISFEVEVKNAEAPVVISSEIVAIHRQSITTEGGDPRQAKVFHDRILMPLTQVSQGQRILLCHETKSSRQILACGIDHDFETGGTYSVKTKHTEDFGQVLYSMNAQPGIPLCLTKYMVYHTTETASPEEMCDRVERTLDRVKGHGFMPLQTAQQEFMDDFWSRSDVCVTGLSQSPNGRSDIEIQQAVRFNLFHILQASARAENTGIPAKGLTGRAYEGQYFWDAEIYVMPFLIYTAPRVAKNMLTFRYHMLDKAKKRAKELGFKGAMFPWRTINGEEASAYYAAGTAQHHINADIMFAMRKYVNATGDQEFLIDYGAEMLVGTARMWNDLGFFSKKKGGKFCINGVTGPDEYNTVVDNNLFTNLMARENLRYAAQTTDWLKEKDIRAFETLSRKLRLDPGEIEEWKHSAENMYIPFDETLGIHPQDDSFLSKEPWDFENTPQDKYPLLLFFHPLTIYRHQVIKQADVVLAMFLLREEFSLEQKKRNFQFYDPLTTGDSSLSSCIQSILALEIGEYEKATRYARAALLMDLADVGGNVREGCHIASMGGGWMILVYGIAGMQDYKGVLNFHPRQIPGAKLAVKFPLNYRGRMFLVEIQNQTTKYSLLEGDDLTLYHYDEEFTLTKQNPVVTRQVR